MSRAPEDFDSSQVVSLRQKPDFQAQNNSIYPSNASILLAMSFAGIRYFSPWFRLTWKVHKSTCRTAKAQLTKLSPARRQTRFHTVFLW